MLICINIFNTDLINNKVLNLNEIAKDIRQAKQDNYNCLVASETLADELSSRGYNARVITGWLEEDGTYVEKTGSIPTDEMLLKNNHAWIMVEVPIEATTGKVINHV